MVFRSTLLDVRPFRTGLVVATLGLLTTLGSEHGGFAGNVLGGGLAKLLGDTGSLLVGVTALARGRSAALGLLVRRAAAPLGSRRPAGGGAAGESCFSNKVASGAAARAAPPAAGRRRARLPGRRLGRPVRASAAACRRARRGDAVDPLRPADGRGRVRPTRPLGAAHCTRRRLGREEDRPADGRRARRDARALRRRRDHGRADLGAARDALRAAARAGDEGLEGRGAQGRPLVRARDDGDPDPRADPRQAGGRGGGAEPRAADRHARRHLRRSALEREPARGLAREGHLRDGRLVRPRAHAAPPDRRHDRLG